MVVGGISVGGGAQRRDVRLRARRLPLEHAEQQVHPTIATATTAAMMPAEAMTARMLTSLCSCAVSTLSNSSWSPGACRGTPSS
jgi:hypothetical protein